MKEKRLKFMLILASFFSVIAFSILAYKVYTTNDTKPLAYTILCLIIASQFLVFLNGIINTDIYVYIPAIIIVCLVSFILYTKIKNEM